MKAAAVAFYLVLQLEGCTACSADEARGQCQQYTGFRQLTGSRSSSLWLMRLGWLSKADKSVAAGSTCQCGQHNLAAAAFIATGHCTKTSITVLFLLIRIKNSTE